jgi:hypothetical protein
MKCDRSSVQRSSKDCCPSKPPYTHSCSSYTNALWPHLQRSSKKPSSTSHLLGCTYILAGPRASPRQTIAQLQQVYELLGTCARACLGEGACPAQASTCQPLPCARPPRSSTCRSFVAVPA